MCCRFLSLRPGQLLFLRKTGTPIRYLCLLFFILVLMNNLIFSLIIYASIQSDARALRTVLSLTGVKEGLRGHIVVELSDLDNEVLVKLVGSDLVETVVAHDVIGRLMIQCARQPGLAQVEYFTLMFFVFNPVFMYKKFVPVNPFHFDTR